MSQIGKENFLNNCVSYFLLKIAAPTKYIHPTKWEDLIPVTSLKDVQKQTGINFSVALLGDKNSSLVPTYIFNFEDFQKDEKRAELIGENFLYSISFFYGPLFEFYNPSIFEIPLNFLDKNNCIKVKTLTSFIEGRSFENDQKIIDPIMEILDRRYVEINYHENVWKIFPILIQNPNLSRGIRYICTSQDNFYIYPESIPRIIEEFDQTPHSNSETIYYEIALHNAFKAVEVILGDPPKDDGRLFKKIRSNGMDPLEEFGILEKKPLFQIIRNMNLARDKIAAHGSTPVKTISIGEMFEFQKCAHFIVNKAIEKYLKDF